MCQTRKHAQHFVILIIIWHLKLHRSIEEIKDEGKGILKMEYGIYITMYMKGLASLTEIR